MSSKKKNQKRFVVSFTATGHGTVSVEASDAEEAKAKVERGEGEADAKLLEWEYDEIHEPEEE